MAFASTSTEFALLDARTTSGAFVLPLTTDIPGRILNIKDPYGAFTKSSIIVYTQGGEAFEDGTTSKVLNDNFDYIQAYTGSTSRWYITGGTTNNVTTANTIVFSTLQAYNYNALCNDYGSQRNPRSFGKISLLDNVFTSSTGQFVSSFLEFGNMNALPNNASLGSAFRYAVGVEQESAVSSI